eukprot:14584297-Alexandrium_andersonii.AAC.1
MFTSATITVPMTSCESPRHTSRDWAALRSPGAGALYQQQSNREVRDLSGRRSRSALQMQRS